MDLRGGTAVVTGAASGVGRAIATTLSRRNMSVVLADVETAALTATDRELRAEGARTLAVTTDVTDPDAVEDLAQRTSATFGPVHLLVNNAGVTVKGRAWELQLDDWRWVIDVCFWGVVHGIRSFVPAMVAHGGFAHVVNTSSMMGLGTAPSGGPYQAAKHAVTALSESLAFDLAEVAPQVGVSVLFPAYTRTRIRESSRNRQARYGTREDATVAGAPPPRTDVARGDPSQIAELLVDGVTRGDFYLPADWELWRPRVAERFAAILATEDPVVVRLDG